MPIALLLETLGVYASGHRRPVCRRSLGRNFSVLCPVDEGHVCDLVRPSRATNPNVLEMLLWKEVVSLYVADSDHAWVETCGYLGRGKKEVGIQQVQGRPVGHKGRRLGSGRLQSVRQRDAP